MPAYRFEIAKTGRAACNGKKPCKGTKIDKGQLRMGVWVEIPGSNGSFKWRHWGCTTPEVIKHWKDDFNEATELDGFDELPEDAQQKIIDAWDAGHVRDEDIPDSAKADKVEEGVNEANIEKPTTKKAGRKTKKDEGEVPVDEDQPKKRKAPVKKAKEEPKNEDIEEKSPQKKRKVSARKTKDEPEKEQDVEEAPKKKQPKKITKGRSVDDTEHIGETSKRGRGRSKKSVA
ncbi:uncharacterized protein L203_100734 [Cryptococcus depauperatus CBS 7841]|uniref:PARP-type domain-containing protein n=1 Tax=Cryptococcus depauperatus CBS 7841 TaxID=1295531 RepID=A0AAJ8LWN0_9TREE